MFYQILISPQVNRWEIITYKHGIYKLPHKLPNDLRPINLGYQENIRKVTKVDTMSTKSAASMPK